MTMTTTTDTIATTQTIPTPQTPQTTPAISGAEPAPGSPEALLLLAGLGVYPASADPRLTRKAIRSCITRLVALRQRQEQLSAEQKELHEQLRLAHLRGDLAAQLPAGKDGNGYQVSPDLLLNRRSGRRQWRYSLSCRELECQLKARQAYEQQSGEATYSLGAAFWELRSSKG